MTRLAADATADYLTGPDPDTINDIARDRR